MINKKLLYVVATPIGNFDDITLRAINILSSCDIIVCEDTRISSKLLKHLNIPNKKLISYNNFNESTKTNSIMELFNNNNQIAIISDAGTPLISDPGYLLVNQCHENNIKVVPIPGASSVTTSISCSGMPCDKFLFLGFLPKSQSAKEEIFQEYYNVNATLIIFESPIRILNTINLLKTIYNGEWKICIARELTKPFEEFIIDSINNIIEHFSHHKPLGEFVIIIPHKEKKDNDDDINDIIRNNMDTLNPSQLAKYLAKSHNMKKKDAYKKILSIKK